MNHPPIPSESNTTSSRKPWVLWTLLATLVVLCSIAVVQHFRRSPLEHADPLRGDDERVTQA